MKTIATMLALFALSACSREVPQGYCVEGEDCPPDVPVFQCYSCETYEVCDATTSYQCVTDPESMWQVTVYCIGADASIQGGASPGGPGADITAHLWLTSGTPYIGAGDERPFAVDRDVPPFYEPPGATPLARPGQFHATAAELQGAVWGFYEYDQTGNDLIETPLGACMALDGPLPVNGEHVTSSCGGVTISWTLTRWTGL